MAGGPGVVLLAGDVEDWKIETRSAEAAGDEKSETDAGRQGRPGIADG